MEQLILFIPNLLGLDPEQFVLWLLVIGIVCNALSKVIPESSTGFLGGVRKVTSILGVALSNRITPNVSSRDINKAIAAGIPDDVVKAAGDQLAEAVATGQGTADFAESIVLTASHARSAPDEYGERDR